MGYYLAIDIGETVGHHMLGYLEKGKLQMEEIHRFKNEMTEIEGVKCWDLLHLFQEIKTGLIKCREMGKLPILVGVDTWGEDFILLDHEDKVVGITVALSQIEIEEPENKIHTIVSEEEFNKSTNNQKKSYKTIHQLLTIKENHPDYLEKVKTLLMIPDYLNFLLTGTKLCEYTIATTTQLVSPLKQEWNEELIARLGYPREIFQEIQRPGTVIGNLSRSVTEEVGFDCIIVLPATYAASSAYFALPPKEQKDLHHSVEAMPLIRSAESDIEYSTAAVGNLLVQMIISHELKDVQAAQECVYNSFVI